MSRFRLALPVVAGLMMLPLATPASATKLDLRAMKCSEFVALPQDSIALILAWIDGLYHDADEDGIVIDTDRFETNAKKLGDYCAKNPAMGVGTAAEQLFGN